MTIEQLLSKLLEYTQNDTIEWLSLSSNEYRYVSEKGGVSIKKLPSNYFDIKLFDLDSCFALYNTMTNTNLDHSAEELFNAIVDSLNRAIEHKIGIVFGEM
ncbi:MAG: hypothetical protein IJR12_05340 [Bacteroidales bacterium]|nr:hypothetical protein [Bacteroidales bacterium]